MSHEEEIYESKKYWRKVKAFLAVFLVAGLIGFGGLSAVLYAFHLDPDTEMETAEVRHLCGHEECKPHPRAEVTYGSAEIAWSGIVFVIYLAATGFWAGVVTDR